jgi:outer membrane protein
MYSGNGMMIRTVLTVFLSCAAARAEVHTMTLREALDLAMKQNPDLVIARLDQLKAQLGVKVARDPFVPKLYGGSGAAWTTGYPATINGSPPSIFQAQSIMAIYNRPQSYAVAQAHENARGADITVANQQDDVAYRVASLYVDAQQATRSLDVAQRQVEALRSVEQNVKERVAEGQELRIEEKRAALDVLKAQQRVESLSGDLENAEQSLAIALGFPPEDRVQPSREEIPPAKTPESESAAVDAAMANSRDMRLMQSQMQAKSLEIRGAKAYRLPIIDLVAQYNLLAKYNFQDYFGSTFQRNNAQLGASITIPLLVGSAARARVQQSEADLAILQKRMSQVRSRIAIDARTAYQRLKRAEMARNVARMDLDVAREQLSLVLAQYDEGRAGARDLEQARSAESDKWLAYYDAQRVLEHARLELLRQTGTLSAAFR